MPMAQCLLVFKDPRRGKIIQQKAQAAGYSVQCVSPQFGFAPETVGDRNAWILRSFDDLAAAIGANLDRDLRRGVPRCTAVIDIGVEKVQDLSGLNPLRNNAMLRWNTVVGMLILAFPEVHWVLANQPGLQGLPR